MFGVLETHGIVWKSLEGPTEFWFRPAVIGDWPELTAAAWIGKSVDCMARMTVCSSLGVLQGVWVRCSACVCAAQAMPEQACKGHYSALLGIHPVRQ